MANVQNFLEVPRTSQKACDQEILIEMYIGHPYLITALFEIRPVAYFGPKQDTFDQQTLLFLLQYGVTF